MFRFKMTKERPKWVKVEKIIKSIIQFKDWYTTELIAVCSKNN